MADFDWHIPPSDKFSFETQFRRLGQSGRFVSLKQMEPMLASCRLSDAEILQIWNLVNIQGFTTINMCQFTHFMHIMMSKRRGRELPFGIPLEIKEEFLKEQPQDSGPYVRPNDNSRDLGAMVNKDLQELKQELVRLDQELDKLTTYAASSNSVGTDSKMQELKQAQKELEGILEYKKAHLNAVQSENAVLEKSVQSQTSAQQQPGNEIRIQQLLAQLRQETETLEKRKAELNQELQSI